MIFCIEGIDASGKNTQSKILAEHLNAAHFSFPDYSTPAGKAILGNLKNDWSTYSHNREHSSVVAIDALKNAMVLQSLMTTNRLERGYDLRLAAARANVVLDRYDASAEVYGAMDGLDPAWVRAINAQLPVRPDIYVFLDVPVEESFKRRPERRDRNEANREYLERVREGYLKLFAGRQSERTAVLQGNDMFALPPRYLTIDGMGTVEEVAKRVRDALFDQPFG